MWWKLTVLALVTIVLAVSVIAIRTHAVTYDPYNEPSPQTWSVGSLLENMYFTPTTFVLVAGILVTAAAVAFWIVRSAR